MTVTMDKPATRVEAPARPGSAPTGRRNTRPNICGFHRFGDASRCPGAIRNGRLGILECAEYDGPEKCLACKTADPEDLAEGRQWRCASPPECEGRVRERQERSALHQQLEAVRTATANDVAARARHEANRNRILADVREAVARGEMSDEDADLLVDSFTLPMPKKDGPAKTGWCKCCGEPTRGGRFLPGHDARMKSQLKKQIKDGTEEEKLEAKKRLTEEGWTL